MTPLVPMIPNRCNNKSPKKIEHQSAASFKYIRSAILYNYNGDYHRL